MSSLEIKDGALVITSGGQQLTLREQLENGTMNIAVEGDITSEAALGFSDELLAAVTVSNGIVLDLSGVGFISNAGFKALLNTQKAVDGIKGHSLSLRGISPALMSSFEEIGFDGLFNIVQ